MQESPARRVESERAGRNGRWGRLGTSHWWLQNLSGLEPESTDPRVGVGGSSLGQGRLLSGAGRASGQLTL